MLKKPEILSPAGDLEKLKYAIAYGADAVYLAGQSFGMRAAASNFNEAQMREGIAYAHARGVKCYITVNIIPSNEDLAALPAYLEQIQDCGADALIAADVSVVSMAKRYAPRVPLHISTQTSILSYEAANFWAEQGAERIVLARELTLSDIAEIRARTPKELELEAFVHGAMCISYSGRCLISQYMTGRDANHGACAQPCRWKYSLVEEKRPGEYFPVEEDERGTYLYNSKDLCMIDHIPELVSAGIDSFKIEGRNKTAYY
ncbi:MAG: peptidase U32 family protein, partial [Butyricicoccus sp.]